MEKNEIKTFFKQSDLLGDFADNDDLDAQMRKAAQMLLPDYLFDKSLTEFSCLDGEDLYDEP